MLQCPSGLSVICPPLCYLYRTTGTDLEKGPTNQWDGSTRERGTKCFLYMDDINILCTDLLSVNRTLDLTDWFGRASGSKLNRNKTQALFYGPWTVTETTGLSLTVTQTDQKILGIKFSREGGGKTNWTDMVGKVRQRLGYWGRRGLTIEGKVLIIKAVILPLLLLISSLSHLEEWF